MEIDVQWGIFSRALPAKDTTTKSIIETTTADRIWPLIRISASPLVINSYILLVPYSYQSSTLKLPLITGACCAGWSSCWEAPPWRRRNHGLVILPSLPSTTMGPYGLATNCWNMYNSDWQGPLCGLLSCSYMFIGLGCLKWFLQTKARVYWL